MSSSRRAARAAVQGPTTRSRPDAPTGGLTSLTPALEASRGHEPEPSPGADWDDDDVDSTGTAGEEAAADESAEEAQLAEKQQQPKLAIEHEFPPILEAVIRDTYSERKEDQDRVKKDMAMAGRPHYKFLSLRTVSLVVSPPSKALHSAPARVASLPGRAAAGCASCVIAVDFGCDGGRGSALARRRALD